MAMTAREYFSRPAEAMDADTEAAFYGGLKMRNNTFKLTAASRFSQIEKAMLPHFESRAGSIREVLDIGASTGITTVELADFLRRISARARVTATDLFIDARIVQLRPGVYVFADSSGWPLQYEFYGTTIRPWIRRLDYLTLTALPRTWLFRWMHRRVAPLVANGKGEPVRMVSRALEARDDIDFVQNDILQNEPILRGRFDFLRAANVLNSNYFSEPDLLKAIDNIRSYLRGPGALVLVTRTNQAGENAGSLLQSNHDGSLQVIARIGSGSEIESLLTRQFR